MSYNPLWDNPASTFTPSVGQNNDVDLQSAGSLIVGALASAFSISGFVGYTLDRTPIYIINASGQPMTLNNNSVLSAVGNSIITPTGADITIANLGAAILIYDSGARVWRVVKY